VTSVLTTSSILLVFLIARQIFNRPVAYVSAILCACNGVLIFCDTSLLIAPLFTFLSMLSLWLLIKLQKHLSWQITVGVGFVLGLTILARSNIVLLLPLIFFWMMCCFPESRRKQMAHYGLMCVIILGILLPVTMRNYFSTHKHPFVLTISGGGMNLWIGNNPSSNGTFEFSGALLQETRERMKAVGSTFVDEVFRFIRDHPKEYVLLEYLKFKMFWRGYEIGNLLPYYFFRQHYSKILQLPWINFVLLGPLSILGMLLACKTWKQTFLLYGVVGVQLLTVLLFFVLARYRLPAIPILSIFAAYACYVMYRCFVKHHYWGLLALLFAFVGLYAGINYPYAVKLYEQQYQIKMPLSNLLRYWDLFHFHVP
jgi:4-amino-4-deoxy-L-arabinose transferase-like glycosyltransferase